MEESKSTDFIPENPNEEYAMLIGRLKAFEAWARNVSEFDFKFKFATNFINWCSYN